MTREEFVKLTENDVIVLNDEPIEKHQDLDKPFIWGAPLWIISDLRKKIAKDTKLQIDNCTQIYKNWYAIQFYIDGIISKNTFNRPFACVAENLCVFFDKIN